jgi:TfoX/Sxy family transcriptional regulator of competence genes
MRPMFGEFVVYVDEKVTGQINEGRLFVKVTKFGEQFAPELERASPYPGAKAAFVVPPEKMADAAWLREFVAGTRLQLK